MQYHLQTDPISGRSPYVIASWLGFEWCALGGIVRSWRFTRMMLESFVPDHRILKPLGVHDILKRRTLRAAMFHVEHCVSRSSVSFGLLSETREACKCLFALCETHLYRFGSTPYLFESQMSISVSSRYYIQCSTWNMTTSSTMEWSSFRFRSDCCKLILYSPWIICKDVHKCSLLYSPTPPVGPLYLFSAIWT